MDDLSRLIALDQIRDLARRYAVYLDARDIDNLVSLYPERIREVVRGQFEESLRSVGITFLHVGNHVVDFQDDEHATGIVYCRGEIQDGGIDSKRWIIHTIQYHDEYVRGEDRWVFKRRRHLLVYGADLGVNPTSLASANWPASQTGMGSVPHDLDTWKHFWGLEPE